MTAPPKTATADQIREWFIALFEEDNLWAEPTNHDKLDQWLTGEPDNMLTDWWVTTHDALAASNPNGGPLVGDDLEAQLKIKGQDKYAPVLGLSGIELRAADGPGAGADGDGGGGGSIYPMQLAAALESRGLLVKNNGVWVLAKDAEDRLLAGAQAHFAAQGRADSEQMEWAEAAAEIDRMSPSDVSRFLEGVYPQEGASYYTIFQNPVERTGAITVPEGAVTTMRQYIPTLTSGQMHSAMFAGAEHQVSWRSVLFASQVLGELDPASYDPAKMDPEAENVFDPFTGARLDPANTTVLPRSPVPVTNQSLGVIAGNLRAGLDLYENDRAFALLHAVNPNLAGKIRNDPYNRSVAEIEEARLILKPMSQYSNLPAAAGYAPRSLGIINALEPAGSLAPEARDVKPDDVRNAYKEMYRSWFLTEPSEEELDAFTDHFDRELEVYQRQKLNNESNPFDPPQPSLPLRTIYDPQAGRHVSEFPSSQTPAGFEQEQPSVSTEIVDYLRADNMYDSLFNNKPGGMSEADYVQSFATKAQTSLGASEGALAQDSIRAGMATGDPRSVSRHAMYSGAGRTSSTLRGRLARAGDVIRRLT
ncbi:MAG: hypothetical protein AB8A39_00120 [Prochlorococcus sp.]